MGKRGAVAYVDRVLRHCDSRIEVRRSDHGSVLYVRCVKPPPRKPRSSSLATFMNEYTLMGRDEYRRRADEKWRAAAAEKERKRIERRAEHERRKQNMHSSMAIEAEPTMNSNEEEGTVSLSPEDHDIERHLVQVAEVMAIWNRKEDEEEHKYDYDGLEVRVMKKAERRVSQKRRALW